MPAVTTTELAKAIKAEAGVAVEKRHIKVPELKSVGSGTAEVTLHKDVVAKVKVVVVAM